jgi:sec-independent protein translocase protein TatC
MLLASREMFGIGPSELIFILVIALLVLGPKRLPELAAGIGKGLAEFRRATADINAELDEARRTVEDQARETTRPAQGDRRISRTQRTGPRTASPLTRAANEDVELPLTGHLAELRRRLARAVAAVAVAFVVTYPNSAYLFDLLEAPLRQSAAAHNLQFQIVGTGIAEAFFTRFGVSLVGAIFLALPVILWQLWRFVAPGLETNEIRYARAFVFFGTLFFLAGASFCYQFVFPVGFPFFLQEYADIGIDPVLRISDYLSFTSRMMFAFGVTFELPVAIFFLARIGLVTWRQLIAFARYAVLVIFIVAAVLTPTPDAASQLLMAIPLIVLYGLSIGVAWAFGKQPAAATEDEEQEKDDAA